ncbi:MAG: hypothetical protein QM737_18695 [Ferruginibacter sp.]
MRIILSILLTGILLSNVESFGQIKNVHQKIAIDVKIDTQYSKNIIAGYKVETTLTNVSNDTISYLTMSCSWEDLYATNRNDYFILASLCDKNIPILARIAPHQKVIRIFEMDNHTKTIMPGSVNLKIGFHFIPVNSSESIIDKSKEISETSNIIWSKELTSF